MCRVCVVAKELHEAIANKGCAQGVDMAKMDIGSIDEEAMADFAAREASREVYEIKKELIELLQRY